MSVKTFENNRWGNFSQAIEFRHKEAVNLLERGSVLDVGCGDGLLLSMLVKKGFDMVWGVDISEKAVEQCRIKNLKATVCDFSKELPFDPDSFDYVVALDVLEHVYNPEILLAEMKRVTKKHLVVGVPNFSSLPARLQVLLGKVPENNAPKKGHVYWFNHKVLLSMAKKLGLNVTEIKTNSFFSSAPVLSKIMKYFSKLFPNIFALSFVVKLSKN